MSATGLDVLQPIPDSLDINGYTVDSIDVEITVYGGFDGLTEELIWSARRAADILSREYGVYAVVVPNMVYWSQVPEATLLHYEYPVLVINGSEVARGSVVEPEEIVKLALELIGVHARENEPRVHVLHEFRDLYQPAIA